MDLRAVLYMVLWGMILYGVYVFFRRGAKNTYAKPMPANQSPSQNVRAEKTTQAPPPAVTFDPVALPAIAKQLPLPDNALPFGAWWSMITDATHLIISGGKGSGKSTMVKAIMRTLAENFGVKFLIVDPHHRKGDYGSIQPYAGGRNFTEAASVFRWVLGELDARFKERNETGREVFDPIAVIIDEADIFTNREVVDKSLFNLAAGFFAIVGDESRKVNIFVTFIFHGTEVKNLGIEGKGSKRDNYAFLRLSQGPNRMPEPTGKLEIGTQSYCVDTRTIPQILQNWQPTADMILEIPTTDLDMLEAMPIPANDVALMLKIMEMTTEDKTPSRREVARRLFSEISGAENYKGDGPLYDRTVDLIKLIESMIGYDPIPPQQRRDVPRKREDVLI